MEDQTNQQPIVTITTHVGFEDYKIYAAFTRLKGKGFSLTMKSNVLLFVFSALLALLVWRVKLFSAAPPVFIGAVIGVSVVVCLFAVQMIWSAVFLLRVTQKSYQARRPIYEAESTDAFFEDHIIEHHPMLDWTYDSRKSYDFYAGAIETESAFYLTYAMDSTGHSIYPKKCMTLEQIVALRELFARKFVENYKGMK